MAHRIQHAHLRERLVASSTNYDPPSIVIRSASTCGVGGDSDCVTPEASSNEGAVVIGVAAGVPIFVAMVVLFFLHRRIKRKTRKEDANDKHKSLDFGMDEVRPGAARSKGMKGPEMSVYPDVGPPSGKRNRGLSLDLDLDLASPYLLADHARGSGESLSTLSRMHTDAQDPYRPSVFNTRPDSREKNNSKLRYNSVSEYDGYSEKRHDSQRNSMLNSRAPSDTSPSEESKTTPEPVSRRPASPPKNERWYPSDDPRYGVADSPDLSNLAPQTTHDMLSNSQLPAYPHPTRQPLPPTPPEEEAFPPQQPVHDQQYSSRPDLHITVPPPAFDRHSPPASAHNPSSPMREAEVPPQFQFELEPPPVPNHDGYQDDYYYDPEHDYQPEHGYQDEHGFQPEQDIRRVSYMGMRPLPHEDPADNPEQRANRIRSFYREYFDESKPNPPGHYPVPVPEPYYPTEDTDDYYFGDGVDEGMVYDPDTGAFYYAEPQPEYAEPINRRAMTPPPRMPGQMRARRRSVMSSQSAARRHIPKKRLPPLQPLSTLPTPHRLRADDMGATIFAPRSTFRDLQLGRSPDSPLGTSRPYSPAFKPHTPIASSFDDLAVIPSPHALRRSGTYTSLDFALPPKIFREGATASDAGSIRSNRSGMSALQRDAIRAGAYRLSRLPTDQVGSRDDFAVALRPKWDLGR